MTYFICTFKQGTQGTLHCVRFLLLQTLKALVGCLVLLCTCTLISYCHEVATEMHVWYRDIDKAIAEATRAVSLNPNDPDANFAMGYALTWAGRHKEAVESYNRAMRRDPFYQDTYGYMLGFSYFHIFQFEKAATLCERSFKSNTPKD